MTAYESFLEQYPRDDQLPKARYRLGMALHQLDRFDEAKPHLDAVVDGPETEPQFRSAVLALADGSFQREAWPEAEAVMAASLSGGKNSSPKVAPPAVTAAMGDRCIWSARPPTTPFTTCVFAPALRPRKDAMVRVRTARAARAKTMR